MKKQLSKVLDAIQKAIEHDPTGFQHFQHFADQRKDYEDWVVGFVIQEMKGCINPKLVKQLVEMEIGTEC
tara:strand:- start:20 stop:229 length:210 start_codon:yes stop_codon:yes gene_type:complete